MVEAPEALRLFLNIYTFVLGAVVGSFLNVCISRLPENKSLVRPGSRCPKCENPIKWHDNLPIISFIILRGKCRNCGEPISLQYPAVELLTAVLFVLLMHRFNNFAAFAIYMVFTCALVVVTFIDLKHYIIPNEISIPGIVVGLLSLIGCVTGGGLLYLTALFSLAVFKKEGMGGGDIKLLAMVGAFLGWKLALMTIVVGSVMGAIVGVAMILLRLKERGDYIPFGPYLALGAVLSMLYGGRILELYLMFGEGLNDIILRFQGA